MARRVALFYFCVLLITVSSCGDSNYKVNLSGIEAKIELKRLENDLFNLKPEEIKSAIPQLREEYGSFLQYFSYVINTGDVTSPSWHIYLESFVTDKMNLDAYKSVMEKYSDISELENGLRQAFRHYLYYFPDRYVPEVYTCITGFNNSIIVADSILGISLDKYLGSDCEYYKMLGIYNYQTLKMGSQNILPDCMYAWAFTEWNFENMDYGIENVFANIIHEGKLYYFVRCMLPDYDELDVFGFTDDQMKFCKKTEGAMWTYLIEHDLLFSGDPLIIKKLTGEAPFTSYFTNESPGKASVWIGFRIVEEYMRNNPDVTLSELMGMTDYQKILSGAKYNPIKKLRAQEKRC